MMHPTIHLNGTGQTTLGNNLHETAVALRVALRKLALTVPHPRDYPDDGTKYTYEIALDEWKDRRFRISSVLGEIDTLQRHVAGLD
jgi:hypothetical protein